MKKIVLGSLLSLLLVGCGDEPTQYVSPVPLSMVKAPEVSIPKAPKMKVPVDPSKSFRDMSRRELFSIDVRTDNPEEGSVVDYSTAKLQLKDNCYPDIAKDLAVSYEKYGYLTDQISNQVFYKCNSLVITEYDTELKQLIKERL